MQSMLWTPAGSGAVNCRLCAQRCHIRKGAKGRCGVRANPGGELVALTRQVVTAMAMDPVEKKPFYHFLPGTRAFSIGSAGCNFTCSFCQNCNISQVSADGKVPGRRVTADEMVALAVGNNASCLAFTYNEPTVFFEQVYETSRAALPRDLRSVLVTNGYMTGDALNALGGSVCAANVDLKSFRDEFYSEYCGARLQPVLDSLKAMRKMGWWLEVTTLVIPGCNDGAAELRELAGFIHDELGPDTPWHLSAFHGAYKMLNHPSTSVAKLEEAWRIGREAGLHFVYIGNVSTAVGGTTFCPSCGEAAIQREGFQVRSGAKNGACPHCGAALAGVWA